MNEQPKKTVFVTIGATASFDALIQACLTPQFLKTLQSYQYTDLVLQYGKSGAAILNERLAAREKNGDVSESIRITGFDFKPQGLHEEMKTAKGNGRQGEGVVICHAGSGTILDGLRISVPLIVVPNSSLLDNHQDELAEELSRQGYVVHGKLDSPAGLEEAIAQAESLRQKSRTWPPVNNGETPRTQRSMATVMDEEMGYIALD